MFFRIIFILLRLSLIITSYQIFCILVCLILLFRLSFNEIIEFNYFNFYINNDLLRCILVYLTFFVVIILFMNKIYLNCIIININRLIIILSLVICFIVDNLFIMYIFFEFSIIPLLIMIIINGSNIERLLANFYLLIYTLIGSFYFLLIIVILKDSLRVRLIFLKIIHIKENILL